MKANIGCVIVLSGILAIFSGCEPFIDNGWDKASISVYVNSESDCTNVSVNVCADGGMWFGGLYKGGEEDAVRDFVSEDFSTVERCEETESTKVELGPVEPFTEYWYVAAVFSPENTPIVVDRCRIYFETDIEVVCDESDCSDVGISVDTGGLQCTWVGALFEGDETESLRKFNEGFDGLERQKGGKRISLGPLKPFVEYHYICAGISSDGKIVDINDNLIYIGDDLEREYNLEYNDNWALNFSSEREFTLTDGSVLNVKHPVKCVNATPSTPDYMAVCRLSDISDSYSLRSIVKEPGYAGVTITEAILVENDNLLWGTFDLEPGLYVAVASEYLYLAMSGGEIHSYSVSEVFEVK